MSNPFAVLARLASADATGTAAARTFEHIEAVGADHDTIICVLRILMGRGLCRMRYDRSSLVWTFYDNSQLSYDRAISVDRPWFWAVPTRTVFEEIITSGGYDRVPYSLLAHFAEDFAELRYG